MNLKLFITKIISCLILLILITSCGNTIQKIKDIHEPVDLRTSPIDPDERAKRNIEEGRGISILKSGDKKTSYEFSTSNPMWRASLEVLDFIPLTTVDYSGGMIITDWYSENNTLNESLKITVRFLSNEVRSDSLKIIIHKKNCSTSNNCNIFLLQNDSKIKSELTNVILRNAVELERISKNKGKNTKKKK